MRILRSQYQTRSSHLWGIFSILPIKAIRMPEWAFYSTNYTTFSVPCHKDEQDTSEKGQFCQESKGDIWKTEKISVFQVSRLTVYYLTPNRYRLIKQTLQVAKSCIKNTNVYGNDVLLAIKKCLFYRFGNSKIVWIRIQIPGLRMPLLTNKKISFGFCIIFNYLGQINKVLLSWE